MKLRYLDWNTFIGFAIIILSIELFGKTDLFSWQMFAQILMLVIGVTIIKEEDQ